MESLCTSSLACGVVSFVARLHAVTLRQFVAPMLTPAKADIYTLELLERFGAVHRLHRELADEEDPCYIQNQENIAM